MSQADFIKSPPHHQTQFFRLLLCSSWNTWWLSLQISFWIMGKLMHSNDFWMWNVEMFSSVFIWLMTNFKCVLGFYHLRPIKQLQLSGGKRVWNDWQVQALRPKCIVGRPVVYLKNTHTYCSLKLCWNAFSEMYTNPQAVIVLKYIYECTKSH